MKTTIKAMGSIVGSLAIVVLGLQSVPECWAQSATPYIPPPATVAIELQTNSQPVSVIVNVTLPQPSPCCSVSNWGQPLLLGNRVSVDAQFWSSSLVPCPDVLSLVTNRYDLGSLPAGDYSFVFGAWGVTVKTQAFSMPVPRPHLSIVWLGVAEARLSWPTNATGYSLECATSLSSPAWVAVTNSPAVTNAEFVLDVDLADRQKYYRLRSP